ncbi:hypothetical protein B0T22DRAFT_384766 [Podospora appendiculata]|uniref:N-acetyltransferase domain-containing protein n=1 Tax=Podospora appendiculata TaxID=314037 RepID=A0AAE0X261_9PEZI|nr:hypothetical protein B0T22DRAFT_384766 [Podospora appendiculata]
MVVVVLPALIPDIRTVYDSYFAAFKNEAMGGLMLDILFPAGIDSDEFRAAHAAGTLAWWHQSATQYTFKAVDTATGDIVGIAMGDIFLRPRSEEERKNHGVGWLEGAQRERAERVLDPLHEMREKLFGGEPYIYSHVIGVDPKYQGRQAGRALAQWGIDLCERTQLPVYFESSPSSVGLYVKLGYERLNETIVHTAALMGTNEDIVVPLMVKMPSGAQGMTFYEWIEKGRPRFL